MQGRLQLQITCELTFIITIAQCNYKSFMSSLLSTRLASKTAERKRLPDAWEKLQARPEAMLIEVLPENWNFAIGFKTPLSEGQPYLKTPGLPWEVIMVAKATRWIVRRWPVHTKLW